MSTSAATSNIHPIDWLEWRRAGARRRQCVVDNWNIRELRTNKPPRKIKIQMEIVVPSQTITIWVIRAKSRGERVTWKWLSTTCLLSTPYNYVAMCAEHVIIVLVTILQNKTTTNSTTIIAAAAGNATDDVVVVVYHFVGSNSSSLHSSLFFWILLSSHSLFLSLSLAVYPRRSHTKNARTRCTRMCVDGESVSER